MTLLFIFTWLALLIPLAVLCGKFIKFGMSHE